MLFLIPTVCLRFLTLPSAQTEIAPSMAFLQRLLRYRHHKSHHEKHLLLQPILSQQMLRILFFSPSLELIGSVVLQGVKEVIMEQIVSSPTISHVFKGRLKESTAGKTEQRI